MRYDEMKRHYPWIEQFFEKVAGLVHAGASPAMCVGALQRDMDSRIQKEHREAVAVKLEKYAQCVEENDCIIAQRNYINYVAPMMCPHCQSIDTDNGSCKWCH